MRILVVGAGGIGGNLAARLSLLPEHETFVLARGAHADAIRGGGLQLESGGESRLAQPRVCESLSEVSQVELAVLAVKDFDLPPLMEPLVDVLAPGAAVLPLLNGLPRAAELRPQLPRAHVLDGCIYVASERVRPGHIRQASAFCRVLLGGKPGDEHMAQRVRSLLSEAGVECPEPPSIETELWRKFLFVCPLAGVTSHYGLGIRAALEHPEARALLEAGMREIHTLAQSAGVALNADAVQQALRTAESFPRDARTSMQLDLEAGRPTELEAFSGAVLRLATVHGLEVPAHRRLYAHLATHARAS